MTLHVHRHRIQRDVRGRRFDMHRERGRIAAEALRADAEFIHHRAEFFFQLRAFRVSALRAQCARRRHLR